MNENEEWWRAHLAEGEEVIWCGGIQKDLMKQPFKTWFWISRVFGLFFLCFCPIMILAGELTGWTMLVIGAPWFASSFVCKKLNRDAGEKIVFAITPHRLLALLNDKGVIEELEMTAFVHFNLEGHDIDFPRDHWRWRYLEQLEEAYEALKQAQRPYL